MFWVQVMIGTTAVDDEWIEEWRKEMFWNA